MTETTLGVLVMKPQVTRHGSVGQLVPGMMAKVSKKHHSLLL